MHQAYLTAGIGIEIAKRGSILYGENIIEYVGELCDKYDARHPVTEPCDGTLLCQRTKYRHRPGCIGKSESITNYVRGIQC